MPKKPNMRRLRAAEEISDELEAMLIDRVGNGTCFVLGIFVEGEPGCHVSGSTGTTTDDLLTMLEDLARTMKEAKPDYYRDIETAKASALRRR
jgi:hypothetical protein